MRALKSLWFHYIKSKSSVEPICARLRLVVTRYMEVIGVEATNVTPLLVIYFIYYYLQMKAAINKWTLRRFSQKSRIPGVQNEVGTAMIKYLN